MFPGVLTCRSTPILWVVGRAAGGRGSLRTCGRRPEDCYATLSLNDPAGQPLGGRSHCLSALREDRLERPVGAVGEHQCANQIHAGVDELSVTERDQRSDGLVIERRERIIRNRQTLKPHAASSPTLEMVVVEAPPHRVSTANLSRISCRRTQLIHS